MKYKIILIDLSWNEIDNCDINQSVNSIMRG